jgi:hypothetical protein
MHALRSPGWVAVVAFRIVILAAALLTTSAITDLGTSPLLISIAGAFGIVVASFLAFSRLTSLSAIALAGSVFAIHLAGFSILDAIQVARETGDLWTYPLREHSFTLSLALTAAFLSTWYFWRGRHAITLEAIAAASLLLLLLAAHRGYHLDRPKIIGSLAWSSSVDPLTMFVASGAVICFTVLAYLVLASLTPRPVAGQARVVPFHGKRQIISTALLVFALTALYTVAGWFVYSHYNANLLSRTANGVGEATSPDMSPLGFHSALGGTAQPAAVVRLEGDYSQNPWSPMMYLRESALSRFNGTAMTPAGRAYDSDVPEISPQGSFRGTEDTELSLRVPVVQSIYLMANQQNAFALDYPLSIVQLKNPKPERFRAAYRAYSIAPAFNLPDIEMLEVGDPRWSDDVRRHYLVPHPDPRYKELAENLTKGIAEPVRKINELTNYLSRTSIYTLTPNHAVGPSDDPVAPFLFGDKRGYCVHFAHAVTYLARSLGIPARIGTGYLTDLSQAKDGHLLLRMSDRHAWPEIYVTGQGWIVFDVRPDNVESHAETQVDAKMLEDLMNLLEPGEEILPKDATKDEPNAEPPAAFELPDSRTVALPLATLAISLLLLKSLLWFGWHLPLSSKRRATLLCRAAQSRLEDLGYGRRFGETRMAHAVRIVRELNLPVVPLTQQHVFDAYSPKPSYQLASYEDHLLSFLGQWRKLPLWKRLFSMLSIRSVISLFSRRAR